MKLSQGRKLVVTNFDDCFRLQDVILKKTIDEYISGEYGKILERNT
jgi:hypothetical protein